MNYTTQPILREQQEMWLSLGNAVWPREPPKDGRRHRRNISLPRRLPCQKEREKKQKKEKKKTRETRHRSKSLPAPNLTHQRRRYRFCPTSPREIQSPELFRAWRASLARPYSATVSVEIPGTRSGILSSVEVQLAQMPTWWTVTAHLRWLNMLIRPTVSLVNDRLLRFDLGLPLFMMASHLELEIEFANIGLDEICAPRPVFPVVVIHQHYLLLPRNDHADEILDQLYHKAAEVGVGPLQTGKDVEFFSAHEFALFASFVDRPPPSAQTHRVRQVVHFSALATSEARLFRFRISLELPAELKWIEHATVYLQSSIPLKRVSIHPTVLNSDPYVRSLLFHTVGCLQCMYEINDSSPTGLGILFLTSQHAHDILSAVFSVTVAFQGIVVPSGVTDGGFEKYVISRGDVLPPPPAGMCLFQW